MFPKCMIGRLPFVNVHGYLMPCCWLDTPRYAVHNKLPSAHGWRDNIFLDDKFDLNKRSYEEVIASDDWAMNLERLFIEQYHMCGMKCGDFAVIDGKPSWNEFEVDDHKQAGTLERSKDAALFDKHRVEPKDISSIQLELTNRCSLKCPYCIRQIDKPKHADLPIEIVKDILHPRTFWTNVEDVGNYGDTMFYKHYIEFLEHLKEANVGWYSGHFAATGKGLAWWCAVINHYKDVIASGTGVRLTFGIDGIDQETSARHRVGQNWTEITTAMRMAADAGCNVFWQFIPMSFNEHQIYDARQLAEDWGVKFQVHTSSRFHEHDENKPSNPNLYRERNE